MSIYQIQNAPAEKDYTGCGKAWVALDNDEVKAIRYMGDFAFDPSKAPAWVKAAYENYYSLGDLNCEIRLISSPTLAKIKRAAIEAGYPEHGPRGGEIKASAIAREARTILMAMEKDQFTAYRESKRDELSELGTVMSGMCSCGEFIPNV